MPEVPTALAVKPSVPPNSRGEFDLRKSYPISYRYIFKRCFSVFLLCGLFLAALSYLFSSEQAVQMIERSSHINSLFGVLFVTPVIVCLFKLTYEVLSRAFYVYRVADGNLIIARGIIIRERGSFPLTKITDIYSEQDFIGAVLGLVRLHFATPSLDSPSFARIPGLTKKSAVSLRRDIESLARSYRMIESYGTQSDDSSPLLLSNGHGNGTPSELHS